MERLLVVLVGAAVCVLCGLSVCPERAAAIVLRSGELFEDTEARRAATAALQRVGGRLAATDFAFVVYDVEEDHWAQPDHRANAAAARDAGASACDPGIQASFAQEQHEQATGNFTTAWPRVARGSAVAQVVSLVETGMWNGHISFVTTCSDRGGTAGASESSVLGNVASRLFGSQRFPVGLGFSSLVNSPSSQALQRVHVHHVASKSEAHSLLASSHAARLAAALKFVPDDVIFVVVLEKNVFFNLPISDLTLESFAAAFLQKNNHPEVPISIAAFYANLPKMPKMWESSATVIHRERSRKCLAELAMHASPLLSPPKAYTQFRHSDVTTLLEFPAPFCKVGGLPRHLHHNGIHDLTDNREEAIFVRVSERTSTRALLSHLAAKTRVPLHLLRAVMNCRLCAHGTPDSDSLSLLEETHKDAEREENAHATSDAILQSLNIVPKQANQPEPFNSATDVVSMPRAPDVVIGGFAKCATTSLFAWLVQHPGVLEPLLKEPNFDLESYQSAGGRQYVSDLHARRLPYGDDNRLTVDGSTHLFWNMTHLYNLKARNPGAKLVAVVCDPIERAVSHWNFRRFLWDDWVCMRGKTLNSVISYQLDHMDDWLATAALDDVDQRTLLEVELDGDYQQCEWHLLREGMYELALRRMESVFPKENIMVVTKDDIQRDPFEVMYQLQQFLNLDFYQYSQEALLRYNHNKKGRAEDLTAEIRERLAALFRPHNNLLRKRINRQLSRWS